MGMGGRWEGLGEVFRCGLGPVGHPNWPPHAPHLGN